GVDRSAGARRVGVRTGAGRAVMKAERAAGLLLPARMSAAAAGKGRPPRDRDRSGRRSPVEPAPLPEADGAAALFAALRDHRLNLSRAQGVPPFVVASDRTLREIAALQPRTVEELMRVYGIGATKAARYGRGFLE